MQTTRIGLLIATAVAIFMVTLLSLGQEQRFWERKVQYEIHFTRTNGLQKGAPVSLTGVTVGSVQEMRFPSDPSASYIQVLVNLVGEVAPRIREDSVASIRTFGLLGDRYIELSAGSPAAPMLPPGSLIPSVDPIDYEAAFGRSGGDILSNVVEVTASLKDVLQSIQRGEGLLGAMLRNREEGEATFADMRQTLANLQQTTRALDEVVARVNRGEGVLGQLVSNGKENAQLLARLNRSARALDEFSTRLNRGRGALVQLIEDEAYARRVLGNLDRAMNDLAELTAKLDRGEGTLGKLVNDPSLYHDARALVGRARGSWFLRWFGGGGEAPPSSGTVRSPEEPAASSAPAGGRP
jgi:phospholipid/cholesterol/gamma-HCH transport system substrate-binding protein